MRSRCRSICTQQLRWASPPAHVHGPASSSSHEGDEDPAVAKNCLISSTQPFLCWKTTMTISCWENLSASLPMTTTAAATIGAHYHPLEDRPCSDCRQSNDDLARKLVFPFFYVSCCYDNLSTCTTTTYTTSSPLIHHNSFLSCPCFRP